MSRGEGGKEGGRERDDTLRKKWIINYSSQVTSDLRKPLISGEGGIFQIWPRMDHDGWMESKLSFLERSSVSAPL